MKKKAIVVDTFNTSQVYKAAKYVKNFVAKYVIGGTVQAIQNVAQIEAHLATLSREFADISWKQFTQAVKARDEAGRQYTLVANPSNGDRVLTIRNASNDLLAKYGTNANLIKYKKRD